MKRFKFFFAFTASIIVLMLVGTFVSPEAGMLSIAFVVPAAFVIKPEQTLGEHIKSLTEQLNGVKAEIKTLLEKDEMSADEAAKFDELTERAENMQIALNHYTQEQVRKLKIDGYKKDFSFGAQRIDGAEKELSKFSFKDFLREVVEGKLTGFNAEMHQEAEKEARAAGRTVNHFGIPEIVLFGSKRDMSAGTTTAGGYTLQNEPLSYIEALKNSLVLVQLGADFLTGLVGNVPLTSENAIAAAVWVTENGDATESNPTFTQATMTPNRLATFIDVSKLLLIQNSVGIEARLRNQLVNAAAQALQSAAINGSGSAPIPRGILNTSGIGSVAIGTNGGAMTWTKGVALETAVAAENALMNGSFAYLTNSKVVGAMKTIVKESGTGLYLIENGVHNGYKVVSTNAVPSTLDKGSSTGVCSAMIFGNFKDLAIGQWGGLDILANPYSKQISGQITYQIDGYYDVKVLRPKSFAACVDITTA